MRRLLSAGLLIALPLTLVLAAHGPFGALAQTTPAPQGDEFNSASFTAPFLLQCGSLASGTCPDSRGASTWSLNGQSPGSLRIMARFGTLVGQKLRDGLSGIAGEEAG
jgi:hypothetical protein